MKNTTKKTLLAGAVGLGLALASAGSAYAATDAQPTPSHRNFFSSLISAIAQKFGLSESDVQKVVDDQVAVNKANMQAKMKEAEASRLAQAVSAGKLTQAQADLITQKQAEIQTSLEALKGKSGQELKDAMKALQDSISQWATANNIPKQYLEPGFGGMRFGRGRMGMKRTQ